MKKTIIVLALLVAIIGGGFCYVWWGPPKLWRIHLGDITAAFAEDLRVYVLQHDGHLPANWVEFENWCTKKDGKNRWPAEYSDRYFELLQKPDNALAEYPRYVRVIDPDFKPMESHINRMIFNAHLELGMTTNVLYPTSSHETSAPHPGKESSKHGI
jgi:hypothetical protein